MDILTTTLNFLQDPAFRSVNRREVADGTGNSALGVNPTPTAGQARANNGAGGAFGDPETSTFFVDVDYKGAFPGSTSDTLWTTGWTALNLRGILVDRGDALSVD